jgi:intein/homing endonuclease
MIRLSGQNLHHSLVKHGCAEKKSLVLQFPTNISSELISHFIRGYFDGDGCI